ncbi:enoyl-CoA hydratase/isomerase family protein [Mesorhizobium sp. 1B3]|uniref:enoyl-CoA hydratase/isomerase family protein n=1 Tax=Mesorhizobium sp. 1B3 TaxID=3243599 RepID=UPI003D96F292
MTEQEVGAPAELDWPAAQIARITLTRASSHNTLTAELLGTLNRLLDEASQRGARVLVVTGSGKTFCGGAHIKYFTDNGSPLHRNPRAIRDDYVLPIVRTFRRLRDAPFVTVAAINGFALGGGCELALSCDFRIMADHARIGLTETRLGALAGAGGVQSLAHVLGRAKALEVALLGEQLGAAEAKALGLVNAVHPAHELDEATTAFARRFLLCSPISVAETKRALYRCETAGADEADRIALDAVAAAASGPEWWEGMLAFTEKRPAGFRMEG